MHSPSCKSCKSFRSTLLRALCASLREKILAKMDDPHLREDFTIPIPNREMARMSVGAARGLPSPAANALSVKSVRRMKKSRVSDKIFAAMERKEHKDKDLCSISFVFFCGKSLFGCGFAALGNPWSFPLVAAGCAGPFAPRASFLANRLGPLAVMESRVVFVTHRHQIIDGGAPGNRQAGPMPRLRRRNVPGESVGRRRPFGCNTCLCVAQCCHAPNIRP